MSIENTEIRLRPTTYNDIGFGWWLYRDLMQPRREEPGNWDETLRRRFIERDMLSGEVSMIVIDGDVAGWIHVQETEQRIAIRKLLLKPRFQNRRIGTMLVHRLIRRAWRTKRELFLDAIGNIGAVRLYERLGLVSGGETGNTLRLRLCRGPRPNGPVLPRARAGVGAHVRTESEGSMLH